MTFDLSSFIVGVALTVSASFVVAWLRIRHVKRDMHMRMLRFALGLVEHLDKAHREFLESRLDSYEGPEERVH